MERRILHIPFCFRYRFSASILNSTRTSRKRCTKLKGSSLFPFYYRWVLFFSLIVVIALRRLHCYCCWSLDHKYETFPTVIKVDGIFFGQLKKEKGTYSWSNVVLSSVRLTILSDIYSRATYLQNKYWLVSLRILD